ncbi:uncharacterized protein RCC_09435 [Ramularia collo-cygni]|uniref:Uncharacterized protein n=1 Tax=Ramularia collo-cygni TaxID=112498 RepID=A0A2D3VHL2_9PEZI|nr:uncharacterized protein RCC_09435 [Ramularia collo-cygni]CZT23721.1 uncharacterized protein RCC_09435 [Ramularia collo-cygni]
MLRLPVPVCGLDDRPSVLDKGNDEGNLPLLQTQCGKRILAAQLKHYPEGFQFAASHPGSTAWNVVLLSPPRLVAVRGHDGVWYRRERSEAVDGPAPYGVEWYRRYQQKSRLPAWLFSQAFFCKEVGKGDSLPGGIDPYYLQTSYPEPPQFPRLKRGTTEGSICLGPTEQLRLTRHFPSTAALEHPREVVVRFHGYITIPDETLHPLPGLADDEVEWVTVEDDPVANNASYIILLPERAPDVLPPPAARQDISGSKQTHSDSKTSSQASKKRSSSTVHQHTAKRILSNSRSKMSAPTFPLTALPRADSVVGVKRPRSESSESVKQEDSSDDGQAQQGVPEDEHISVEEAHNFLSLEPLADALKQTVEAGIPSAGVKREEIKLDQEAFREMPHLHAPATKGTWYFSNPDIAQAAVDCFADQIGFDTEGIEHPTAAHIFRIRESTQYYLNIGLLQQHLPGNWDYHDPTLDIDLSFVGDEEDDGVEAAASWIINTDELPPKACDFGTDQYSNIKHAPWNNGTNDQRGLFGQTNYSTRKINGEIITLDRAVAIPNKEFQCHKSWIHRGRWQMYAPDIDWNDKKSLDSLNKWRNQTLERDGWPLLRQKVRKIYDAEQRTWLFKHIALSDGNTPREGYTELARKFNEHFELTGEDVRGRAGIATLCKRLCQEFKENDGKEKPVALQRGNKKRARVTAGEGEESESESVEASESEEESEVESEDDPLMEQLVEELLGKEDSGEELDEAALDQILEMFG